jgi:hypothetical protein
MCDSAPGGRSRVMGSTRTANDPSAAVARRATGSGAAWVFLRPTPFAALSCTGFDGSILTEDAASAREAAARTVAGEAVRQGRPVLSPEFIAVALEVEGLDGAIVVAQGRRRREEAVLEALCGVTRDFVGLRLYAPDGPRHSRALTAADDAGRRSARLDIPA